MAKEMPTKREESPKFPGPNSGRKPRGSPAKASSAAAMEKKPNPRMTQLMEAVVERSNMIMAMRRLEKNKGSGGIDEMTTQELRSYLKEHWPKIKEELLEGGLSSGGGAASTNRQAGRRNATAGHSRGGGPIAAALIKG